MLWKQRQVWRFGGLVSAGQCDPGRGKSPVGSRMCILQPSHIGQWMERRHPPPENSEVGVVCGVFIFANRYDCHVGSYSLEFVLLV